MASSELFFVVDPISSLYSMTIWDFFVFGICIAGGIFLYYSPLAKIPPSSGTLDGKSSFVLPDISDIQFEAKIAQILRILIGYPGASPEAHTAREIERYSHHELIGLLRDIESVEYKGQSLTQMEKKSILSKILVYKKSSYKK